MDQPAPLPPNSAELAVVERFAALIDGLCAAILAELAPRTWWGALFGRITNPLAEQVCGLLRGMSERFRALVAEVALRPTPLPAVADHARCDAAGIGPAREDRNPPSLQPSRPPLARDAIARGPELARDAIARGPEPAWAAEPDCLAGQGSPEPAPSRATPRCAAAARAGAIRAPVARGRVAIAWPLLAACRDDRTVENFLRGARSPRPLVQFVTIS